jgi:hypothetical protein
LLVVTTTAPASTFAHEDLLKPSPRALAAADKDEPPPRLDQAPLERKPVKPVVADDDSPVYRKWWFWAVAAAVVGGTIAFGALTFTPAAAHPRACPPTTRLCFGDGRQ